MTRYKITLEYDGTDLIGWQANQDGPSVQSILSDAIHQFSGEDVVVYAAGRTDAGVHATGMVAHFDLEKNHDASTVMRAINFYLKGAPVVVLDACVVADDFHARFDCKGRRYRYAVLNRPSRPVIDRHRVWWIARPLNVDAMRIAAKKFIGTHDFTSFRASMCQSKSPIKTMDQISITTDGDFIFFDFAAKSFLHHQIRNIMGTLIEIGHGKPLDIDQIFAARDRSAAGPTAPSDGLYFVEAIY